MIAHYEALDRITRGELRSLADIAAHLRSLGRPYTCSSILLGEDDYVVDVYLTSIERYAHEIWTEAAADALRHGWGEGLLIGITHRRPARRSSFERGLSTGGRRRRFSPTPVTAWRSRRKTRTTTTGLM